MASESHDLLWLAFRYVSGEMDAEESTAFEERLAHDQSAREAVAEAVELAEVVALARLEILATLPSRHPRILAWLVTGAAACLAIVIGQHLLTRASPDPAPSKILVASGGEPSPTIALAWSGLRQREVDAPGAHSELLAWLDEPSMSVSAELGTELAARDDGSLPLWLVEAASLRDDSRSSGSGVKED